MKIKSLMISEPITITERSSIREAIEIMKANSIRHLPVVSKGNKLIGFITLADLKIDVELLKLFPQPVKAGFGRWAAPGGIKKQDQRTAIFILTTGIAGFGQKPSGFLD